MKILFTGGGSGGHIVPIISIVREIRALYLGQDLKILYTGPKDSLAEAFLSQEGIRVGTILSGKIRRYTGFKSIMQTLIDLFFKVPVGVLQSFWQIFFLGPDLVFSKGGYGSFPVVLSAWILGVPVFLHESDVSPGLVNRITSRMALEIFVSFPKTEYFSPQKSIIVGSPVRKEILDGSAAEAREKFHLGGGRPTVLVLGGSQGAQRINDVILAALPDLLVDFEILHQTGEQNFATVKAEAEVVIPKGFEGFYHPFPFLREQELKHAYKVADLIVARAGAGTIFEIAACGKPSILVPLFESAQNHQYKNAYAYAAHGAALVLEEPNLYPHFLLERMGYLFTHKDEYDKMVKAAQGFASPKASQIIAEYLLGYLYE